MYKKDILTCYEKIKGSINKTPILTSTTINSMAKAKLFFKCENFQKTGSFKVRGALNAIHKLKDEEKKRGVVTHSSGNFAQALSYAASLNGIKAYIVMPKDAPTVKKNAVKGYGGQIIECEPTYQSRCETAAEIVKQHGAKLIHSSNNIDVIIGQATVGYELIEEIDNLDYIIAPIGGGGLMAGTGLSAKYFGNNCIAIGGEPFNVDDAYRSLISGKLETNLTTNTIADGLKTPVGDITFPLIKEHVLKIIRVSEKEIAAAMKLIWERMKIVIEPSAAVPFAAILREKNSFVGKSIGIILSGGNVDLDNLPF